MGCLESKVKDKKGCSALALEPSEVVPECGVCYEKYDTEHRIPISLPCFHTICQICINSMPKKECPFDHKHFTTYGRNFQLIQCIETLNKVRFKAPKTSIKTKDQGHNGATRRQSSQAKDRGSPPYVVQENQFRQLAHFQQSSSSANPPQPHSGVIHRRLDRSDSRGQDLDYSPFRRAPDIRRVYLSPVISVPSRPANSPALNPCRQSHNFEFLSYQAVCSQCERTDRVWQCSGCRTRKCKTCHNVQFQAKVCPSQHQTRWVSYKDKCAQCKEYQPGYHCARCSYHYCDRCCDTKFLADTCPNNHSTVHRKVLSTCVKCNNVDEGKSCRVCLYHLCFKCH